MTEDRGYSIARIMYFLYPISKHSVIYMWSAIEGMKKYQENKRYDVSGLNSTLKALSPKAKKPQ